MSVSEAVDAQHDSAGARRWWSVREIADDLAISLNTVYKWSSKGEPWFPHSIRLANGAKRVRGDWYEEWLAGLELPSRI